PAQGDKRGGERGDRHHQRDPLYGGLRDDGLSEKDFRRRIRRLPVPRHERAHHDERAIARYFLERHAALRKRGRVVGERLIARNGDQDRAIAPALQHLELGQVLRYAFRQAVHQYGRLRYRYLEARPGRPHDEPAVDRLDAVLGRKRVLALPLAQHIRPPPAGLQPELPKLAQEVVLVPRLHADEVHVVVRDARAEPVFGGHAVSLRELGHPADQRLVGGAQRIFDRRARADHHDHSVILPVERVVVPRRVVDGPVALPELADVTDERKPARRVVPDVGGVLGRAVHEIPFREGEGRLIAATPVLFGRNGGRPSGKDRGAEGEREATADRRPAQDAVPSPAARPLTQ